MTKVLTLRVQADLLGKAEARALQLGLDRAKYVRSLIEEDLAKSAASPHRFASEDLAGIHEGVGHPADNQAVRRQVQARALRKSL